MFHPVNHTLVCARLLYTASVCVTHFLSKIEDLNRANGDELRRLKEAAARSDWQRKIALQLTGRCGLCTNGIDYPGDAELRKKRMPVCRNPWKEHQ